ncbi:AaceriAFR746Cp [[Ashbya] aceris (nom. inval.)]|nr:AaceriAFR746Cp [[Ashbya] aceris (nom. inval.)]
MDGLQRTVLALQTRSDELVLQLRSSVVECERVGREEICCCAVRARLAESLCDGVICQARRWEFYAVLMQLTSLRVRAEHISGTLRSMLRRGEWDLQEITKQFQMVDALSGELDGLAMVDTPCGGLESQGDESENFELRQLELSRLSTFSGRSETVPNKGRQQLAIRSEIDRVRGTRIREIAGDGRKLQNSRAPELVPGRVISSNTSYDSSSLFRRSLDGHLSEVFDGSYHSDEETVVSVNQHQLGDCSSVISPGKQSAVYPKIADLPIGQLNSSSPLNEQLPTTYRASVSPRATAAVTYYNAEYSFGEPSKSDQINVTHGFLKSLFNPNFGDRQTYTRSVAKGQSIFNFSRFVQRWNIFHHRSMIEPEGSDPKPLASADDADSKMLHDQNDSISQKSNCKISTFTKDTHCSKNACSKNACSDPTMNVTMTPVLYDYLKEALETELSFN